VKTEDFYVCCGYSDVWRVWFNETVIITVLKSIARKRLVKTKDFMCAVVTVIFGMCGSVGLFSRLWWRSVSGQ
jgi:hypothetical protein